MKESILGALILLLVALLPTAYAQNTENNDDALAFIHDGIERRFYVHLPPDYDSSEPTALVIVLHGAGMTGLDMMLVSEFNANADAAGAIVVYPNGLVGQWNRDEEIDPEAFIPDDVAFLSTLIEYMRDTYTVDPARVYLAGYSNGGMMALRAACDLSGQVAAVAVVAANLSFDQAERCVSAEPLSYLIVLGTEDRLFPWQGYAVMLDGEFTTLLSVSQAMRFLSTLNACQGTDELTTVSPPDGPAQVIRDVYHGCIDDTQVMLYALVDIDHTWPSKPVITLQNGETGGIKEAIWEFFGFPAGG